MCANGHIVWKAKLTLRWLIAFQENDDDEKKKQQQPAGVCFLSSEKRTFFFDGFADEFWSQILRLAGQVPASSFHCFYGLYSLPD